MFFKVKDDLKLTWPLFFPFLFVSRHIRLVYYIKWQQSILLVLLPRWPVFLYFAYIFVPANIISDAKTLKRVVIIVSLFLLSLVLASGFMSLIGQDWQNSFFRLKSLYIFNSFPFGENHNLVAEFFKYWRFLCFSYKGVFKKQKRQTS